MSKTPQFAALLDQILNDLVPHERHCVREGTSHCEGVFPIMVEDIEFYKMLRVPPPTHCPTCRHQRRLAFANYSNIYRRACDVPGHADTMISVSAPVVPLMMYDYDTYYSDQWDPLSYGKTIQEGMTFSETFESLLREIPYPGVRRGPGCMNSDFSFYGKGMKDCYYVFGSWDSEDVMYGAAIFDSRHVVDSYYTRSIDTAYENVLTDFSSTIFYAYFSTNCIDCRFIYDCRNCQNCFGCVNLRNKQYCWFNEQLTKEEYQSRLQAVDLGDQRILKEYVRTFWEFVKANPIRATRIFQSENVSGNDIKESKNCHKVFQVEQSENVRFGHFYIGVKDSMDAAWSGYSERLYDTQNVGTHSSNVTFSFATKESRDSEFLMNCNNCSFCFGCIGLKNTSYAIFNTIYEPEEYFKRIDEIKCKMLQEGEYGEFFPMTYAPYAYNSSLAQVIYPLEEKEVLASGLLWQPEADVHVDREIVYDIPHIHDVSYEICDKVLIGASGKPFRLIPREIDFYKRYGLALPSDTPRERIVERFGILSNFHTYAEKCARCSKEIPSAYKREDGYHPYCRECYQSEIL